MIKKSLRFALATVLAVSLLTACGDSKMEGGAPSPVDASEEDGTDVDEGSGDQADGTDEETGEEKESFKKDATVETNVKKDGFALEEITMLKGESLDLQYQFAKKKFKCKWVSSDPKVVKVSKNGSKITAKKVGEASVEGVTEDGQHSFRCNVTVEKKPNTVIYLTFDDGPTRYSTPKVLDILKKNNVKATFFEIKPAKADYDLTKRVIKEGHTLAIHGYSHSYDKIYKNEDAYHQNLTKLQSLFYKKFGVWATQSRFPGGSSNTISRHYSKGIMTRLSKKVHGWGFKYQDWNVSSGDAGGSNNAKQVYKAVTSGVQEGRGNVVLMHDFNRNDKTINALQNVIDWGKSKGYEFRAMTAATGEVHHGINN